MYAIDSEKSFAQRRNVQLGIIPKLFNSEHGSIIDYLKKSISFQRATELIEWYSLTPEEFINYLIYYRGYKDYKEFEHSSDYSVVIGLSKELGLRQLYGYDSFYSVYTHDLKTFENEAKKTIEIAKKVEAMPVDLVTSEIKPFRINLQASFECDLEEIFNDLVLDELVPFVNFKNFFKVHKDFKPPVDWAIETDFMLFRVNNKKNKKSYCPVALNGKIISIFTEVNEKNEVSEFEILNRLNSVLKTKISVEKFIEVGVDVEYYIQMKYLDEYEEEDEINFFEEVGEEEIVKTKKRFRKQLDFNMPLFHDYVMNDPVVSKILIINEKEITLRKKGGVYVYFRYLLDELKNTIRITPGITEAYEIEKTNNLLKIGSKFLYVKILSCESVDEAEKIKNILDKILTNYFS